MVNKWTWPHHGVANFDNGDSIITHEQLSCGHEFILLATRKLELGRFGQVGAYQRVIGCKHCFIVYYQVKNSDTFHCMSEHLAISAGEEDSISRHYFTRMRLFARVPDPRLLQSDDS